MDIAWKINIIVLVTGAIIWWVKNLPIPLEIEPTASTFVLSFFLPVIVVIALGLLISVLFWPFLGILMWTKIQPFLSTTLGKCCGVAVLTMLAFILYAVRRTMRTFYGVAETIVGISVCGAGMKRIDTDAITSVFAFASGVYVIVRGLDNFFEGRRRASERTPSTGGSS